MAKPLDLSVDPNSTSGSPAEQCLNYLHGPLSTRSAWTIFVAVLLAVCGCVVGAGGVYLSDKPVDFFIYLDGLWRLDSGQAPYRDFPTPIGPVFYWLMGLARRLCGPTSYAVTLPTLPIGIVTAAGTFELLRARTSPRLALAIAIAILLRTVSPRANDAFFLYTAYLAPYDRMCDGLLAVVLVGLCMGPGRSSSDEDRLIPKSIFIGICTVLLLFIKASYILPAAMAYLSAAVNRDTRKIALLGFWSSIATVLPLAYAERDRLIPYLANMRLAGQATDWTGYLVLRLPILTSPPFLLFAATILIIVANRPRPANGNRSEGLISLGFLAGAVWSAMFNDYGNVPALLPILALAATTREVREPSSHGRLRRFRGWSALLFIAIAGFPLLNDAAALPFSTAMARLAPATPWPASEHRLDGLKLQNHRFAAASQSTADATALLERYGMNGRALLVVDYASLVPTAAGSPDARGAMAWMAPDRTFSIDHHPEPTVILGDAEAVMVPKKPFLRESVDLFDRIYGADLRNCFSLGAEDEKWTLYVRSDGCPRRTTSR